MRVFDGSGQSSPKSPPRGASRYTDASSQLKVWYQSGYIQNLQCGYEKALLKSWSGRMDGAARWVMGESRANDKRRYASHMVGKVKQDVNRTTQGFQAKCWVYRPGFARRRYIPVRMWIYTSLYTET